MQIETETSAHFRPEVESLNHPETKVGTRMKRYLAIVLLTALVLALCLPIFARYEVCTECYNGRFVESEKTSRVTCPVCNQRVTKTVITVKCSNCGHTEPWDTILSCGH